MTYKLDTRNAVQGAFKCKSSEFYDNTLIEVTGHTIGVWGVYKRDDDYQIIHIPTGLCLTSAGFRTKTNAFVFARELSAMVANYDLRNIDNIPEGLLDEIKERTFYWRDMKRSAPGYTQFGLPKKE